MKITTLYFHVKELLMNVLVLFSEKKNPKKPGSNMEKGKEREKEAR